MDIVINGCNVCIPDIPGIISFKKKTRQQVVNLKEELKEKEADLKKAEEYLLFNCEHNWVTDSIDCIKGYKQCVRITYCSECELSR
jgi:hypothetical protein